MQFYNKPASSGFVLFMSLFLGAATAYAGTLFRSNLDGTELKVVTVFDGNSLDVEIDPATNQIYWSNVFEGTITRANLDGSNSQIILSNQFRAFGLAIDSGAGKIYWANEWDAGRRDGKILRANLDGTGIEELIDAPGNVRYLDLDTSAGLIYWSDPDSNIFRSNYNGSGTVDIIIPPPGQKPDGIALDLAAEKIYWGTEGFSSVQRADTVGTNIELLASGFDKGVTDVEIDTKSGKLYWDATGAIYRSNLDGSSVEIIVVGDFLGIGGGAGLALDLAADKLYFTAVGTVNVVSIDIKPANKKNVVNPNSRGNIWVAILSDTDADSPFDPSSQVDIPTVEFGPDGAMVNRHKVKDINKDGLGDLLLRFKISETGIACGDTEATLTGDTFEELIFFTGTDSIKTVGCKPKKCHKKHHDDDRGDDKKHHGKHKEKKYHNKDHDSDHKKR